MKPQKFGETAQEPAWAKQTFRLRPMDQEPAGLALLTALITAKPADVLEVGSLAMQRANFAQALRSPLTAPSEPLFAEPADDDATFDELVGEFTLSSKIAEKLHQARATDQLLRGTEDTAPRSERREDSTREMVTARPLPRGWLKVESRSRPGVGYYYDRATSTSQWRRPLTAQAPPPGPAAGVDK